MPTECVIRLTGSMSETHPQVLMHLRSTLSVVTHTNTHNTVFMYLETNVPQSSWVCPGKKYISPSKQCIRKVFRPRKGLKITLLSLSNKVHEINNLLTSDNIHVLAISETHLDNSFVERVDDFKNIYRSDVINEEHPDAALDEFMKLLLPVIDKHAPVKKLTVRTVKAPRIDEELNNCMVAKGVANKSGCTSDWLTYCKLRNCD